MQAELPRRPVGARLHALEGRGGAVDCRSVPRPGRAGEVRERVERVVKRSEHRGRGLRVALRRLEAAKLREPTLPDRYRPSGDAGDGR
jgi:hypothetical protein